MVRSTATVRSSLVERAHGMGIYTVESSTTVQAIWVRDTATLPSESLFGDGLMALALNGELLAGRAFAFEDRGGNVCSCNGAATNCAVRSVGLAPPDPLEPL